MKLVPKKVLLFDTIVQCDTHMNTRNKSSGYWVLLTE